jgi:phospholipid/cholesterol/gamma-HCH transport system ATP-binding protein
MIRIQGLRKSFGSQRVLQGVDLDVATGEVMIIIGRSGGGKSVLLKHLIGLLRPDAGRVLVDGTDIVGLSGAALDAIRARYGVVFQGGALFDSMSVFDNVAFPLREQTKLSEREVRERVMTKLKELQVDHAAKKMPAEISGGMAKRVGIARALVMEPEILIYDEPTSGLDPVTSRIVDSLIEEMRERFAVTSVVITHDMVSAFDIADRVALLVLGKIAVEGPPGAVLQSDREDVRRFVSSSGVDAQRLDERSSRKTPDQIRETWRERQSKS